MFGFRRANNSGVAPTIKRIAANTAVTYNVGDALVITSGKAALAGSTAKPEYIAAQGGLGLDTLSVYQVNGDQEYETTLAETGAVVVGTKVTLSSSNSIARKRGRNGGIKSGEVRRQKKTMRETLENALKIELSKEKLEELGADIGLMNGETSVLSAIIASTIREAIGGDTKAIQFVRDSIGEQPKTEVVQEVITKDDMALMESLRNSLIDKVM